MSTIIRDESGRAFDPARAELLPDVESWIARFVLSNSPDDLRVLDDPDVRLVIRSTAGFVLRCLIDPSSFNRLPDREGGTWREIVVAPAFGEGRIAGSSEPKSEPRPTVSALGDSVGTAFIGSEGRSWWTTFSPLGTHACDSELYDRTPVGYRIESDIPRLFSVSVGSGRLEES